MGDRTRRVIGLCSVLAIAAGWSIFAAASHRHGEYIHGGVVAALGIFYFLRLERRAKTLRR